MQYYSYPSMTGGTRLIAGTGSENYDLTSARDELRTFYDLVKTANIMDVDIDQVAKRVIEEASTADKKEATPSIPLTPDEVWAAGVTYKVSEEARRAESDMSEFYVKVYEADRPEIFFKATPNRTVGPGEAVGIRRDSSWDVPEPELAVVLYRGEIVGYTIGNDMSSRSIEGTNPLYLPQAKIYDRCCSIGPCIVSKTSIDPYDLTIEMSIERDGNDVFNGSISTSQMVRSYEELTEYFCNHNEVPELTALLGGTSIVPPEDFTLQEKDRIRITVDGIGTLKNSVERV